ncbi:MAG: pyridoxal-dependent decarboxylase [Pseudomonadota bacterium]
MSDAAFAPNAIGLTQALELMRNPSPGKLDLPDALPEEGLGERAALNALAPGMLGHAADLGTPHALAHMDPPTPWITWAVTQWASRLNQNLLHPATSPVAGPVEERVIDWVAPAFGMDGGHMVPGATLANLTALWAAREIAGIRQVVTSAAAHLSVRKSAHILGLEVIELPVDAYGAMASRDLPDLSAACLVLTAGTTSAGAIDPLALRGAWTHVDAAWAGPLRLTRYAERLDGIETADSVAVSAHKWLYQPKESALVMFRDSAAAHQALSFGGAYLDRPNIGVLGSHGATAAPLLATLLAWGRAGLAARIEANMEMAERLAAWVDGRDDLILYAPNRSGVVLWRSAAKPTEEILQDLPNGLASTARLGETTWMRNVAANPQADIEAILTALEAAV